MEQRQVLINDNDDSDIDLKEIFKTIYRYRYTIVLLTLLFSILSFIFAYTKPNIYSSSLTVELTEPKKNASSEDFILQALEGSSTNVDNQIEVFKSWYIAKKTFEYLDLGTNFSTTKNFRKIDLYKTTPFVVQKTFLDDLVYKKNFVITPIDDESFNLQIKPASKASLKTWLKELGVISLRPEDKINYNKNHKYGENIKSQWFEFSMNKVHSPTESSYEFSFMDAGSFFEYFLENLSISQTSKKATVLKLNFEDTSNIKAKDILNTIYKTYIEDEVDQKTKESTLSLDFIDKQLDALSIRLSKSATNLETYKEENKVVGLGEQAIQTTEQLSEYEAKLEEIQTEINILSNLQTYINSNQDLTGLSVGAVTFADPALGTLVTKLQELATEKISLAVDFTEIHPDVIRINENISSLKRSIKGTLRNNLRQLGQRKASFLAVIEKFNKSIATLPKQEKELSRLSRHYNIDEKIYSFLLEKKAETAILKSSTISNSRLLVPAKQKELPVKPKRTLIVLVGFILGLICGIAYAFLREFMNNTVKTAEEAEKLSSIPLYGIIPEKKGKKAVSIFKESFRNLRTNLQFLPNTKNRSVIAITSSVSGEGKTTISAEMANIISKNGKKVIVLDVDLRKASVHREFDAKNEYGISNYLTGDKNLEDIVQPTGVEDVDLITTGPLPPNPSEMINSEKMQELIEILKQSYDYVILDTPPVGLVTDALILMNYVDMTFVIVRAGFTRKEFIKNLDRLAREHSHNHIGMILNGVEVGDKYGYGYGVSYGYGYGKKYY